jgi:hypothetical protein
VNSAAARLRQFSSGLRRPGRRLRTGALGTLGTLSTLVLLGACASAPPHYPSAIAEKRIGKPLFNLEMRWSTPSGLRQEGEGRIATWRFNQYNYAGCNVEVRTDRHDIIRHVSWTTGCGPPPPKRSSAPPHPAPPPAGK